jgi:hypothetical protein
LKITIRLRENKDQDLIGWINSLEEGSRSRVIRNILKANTNKGGINKWINRLKKE